MTSVCLRPVTVDNFRTCVRLSVRDDQKPFVATNMESLAQAYVNEHLTPCAIYEGDVFARRTTPEDPMVGFVMYQVKRDVGFIMRLMVAAEHQGNGYGRAAMHEVIRRMKADPVIERIATSVLATNDPARQLYLSLGFEPFEEREGEVYMRLPYGRDA